MMGSGKRASRTKRTRSVDEFGFGVVPAANVVVNDAPDSAKGGFGHAGPCGQAPDVVPAATVDSDEVPTVQKVKGAVQMAGGAALIAAGVPMCVLPGPGAATIAGGAALASKGQRNYSGREATPVEEKLDAAAAKLGEAAKGQAAQAARTAAEKAPEIAGKAARVAQAGMVFAARGIAKAAKGGSAPRNDVRRKRGGDVFDAESPISGVDRSRDSGCGECFTVR